jgi:GNAT superfamily N-acetyltransferase
MPPRARSAFLAEAKGPLPPAAPLHPGLLLVAGCAVLLAFAAAARFPLATYGVTLALFGLPHVVSELRYVDARFGRRLGARLLWLFAGLLGAIVFGRLGSALGWWSGQTRLELLLVAGLALPAVLAPGARLRWRLVAVAAVAGLAAGVIWAPVAVIVTLAVAHNFTPLGFVAERLEGCRRKHALAAGALLFVALPLLLLTGVPQGLLGTYPDAAPLPAGGLEPQLRVFVIPAWQGEGFAPLLFAAAAFTQCLHYLYVLVLLPAYDRDGAWWGGSPSDPGRRSLLPWPSPVAFALALAGVACVSLALFLVDFGAARTWYGLAAAVHAWIEVPVLLLAPTLLARARTRGADD